MKYAVVTFGCRVNQAESLAIEAAMRARGATGAAPDDADVVVVNTCSVTASADQGARQTIRRVARVNPAVRIVVTGCYATRQPGEVAGLPNVVHVVGNAGKDVLVDAVAEDIGLTTARRFGDGDGPCGNTLTPGTGGRTVLTLRVQTGCEETCSYCIIPSTRGMSRSRSLAGVVRDVQGVVDAGYKEVVITGVHLGSYGRDLTDGSSLATLIRMLRDWPADVLFRISSLEPMDCTPEIVEMVASSQRLKRFSNRPCTTWGGRGTSARTDAGGPMRAYSMDLRERALLDSDAGMTAAEVAAKYRVSGSWVRLLKQRRRDTGEVAPRVQRHGRRCMLEPHLHTLAALIAAHPDRTLAELKDALATPASVPTVWRAVRALGLTVKKHGPPVRTRSA